MKTRTRRSTKRQSPSKENCSPSRAPLLPRLPPAPALSLFIPLHAPAAISLFCFSTCSRGGSARYSYPSPELSVATPSWFLVPLFLFPLFLFPFPLFFFLFPSPFLHNGGSRPVPTCVSHTHQLPVQCPHRLGLLGFSPLAFVSCLEEREEMSPALVYLISSGTVALAGGSVGERGGVYKDVGQKPL